MHNMLSDIVQEHVFIEEEEGETKGLCDWLILRIPSRSNQSNCAIFS